MPINVFALSYEFDYDNKGLIGGAINCGKSRYWRMESQNIEYKQSWKDEYLKWICGFANAQGGTLYVGIDDNGSVCGVKDARTYQTK